MLFTFSLYRYILLISVFIGGNSLINAIGLVFILTNKHEKKKKVYLNEKFALIDIIDSKEVIDDEGNSLVELTCKYSIYLDENTTVNLLMIILDKSFHS